MSEKDKRVQASSPAQVTGGGAPSVEVGESNAQMMNMLKDAKRGPVPVYLGGNVIDLSLPDVEQLPASTGSGSGDKTGTLDRYQAWLDAVKALRVFEDQHNDDLFSYGVGESAQERFALTDAVKLSFGAMSPEERQVVYESEVRFAEWKKDFDVQSEAQDKEKRRVWMYEYAGLDPDVRVSQATLNEAFEQAKQGKARQSLHEDITGVPNMIGGGIQGMADDFYGAAHASKTGNEGWLDGAAKSLWNLGVDAAHMVGHVGGSAVQTAGEMAGGAAVTAADPGGSFDRYVDDKESSRKNIRQTLADGGGGGGLISEAHAAILAYTPGVQDIGEGFSNTSLESPEQTEAWKNRSASDRVVQSAGGISALSGTLAGVGGGASNVKGLLKPKKVKAPTSTKPGSAATKLDNGPAVGASKAGTGVKKVADDSEFWTKDDFLGGQVDPATRTAIQRELADDIDGMNLSPDELKTRKLENGLTGLRNAPEEWMPKYHKPGKHGEAFDDVWGHVREGNARSAAEAATLKLDEYRGCMARGETPTGKLHWSEYGNTPEAAVHSMRRLGKTYSLLEGKGGKPNPTARARAAIFDTLADWAEKTEGLRPVR